MYISLARKRRAHIIKNKKINTVSERTKAANTQTDTANQKMSLSGSRYNRNENAAAQITKNIDAVWLSPVAAQNIRAGTKVNNAAAIHATLKDIPAHTAKKKIPTMAPAPKSWDI